MPPEETLLNSTEARTETGELKDQTSTIQNTETNTEVNKTLLNEESKIKEKTEEKLLGAPEKYESWKLPEGYELDEKVGGEANNLFKELGLTQDAGQKLIDMYAKVSQDAAEAPLKLWQDTQKAWVDEIKADPEIGGKLDEVKTTVSRAIDSLGDPALAKAFREAMDYTGAGNNPAFVRAFYKLAQKVTEGKPVSGRGPVEVKSPTGQRPTAAEAMYPTLAKG